MRYSNYRNPVVTGTNLLNKKLTAEVDVTTGFLFWKKTETRRIGREALQFYVFLDTGEKARPAARPGIVIQDRKLCRRFLLKLNGS